MRRLAFASFVLVLFCSSGCFSRFVYVHDRYPVYDIPEKAEIEVVSADDLAPLAPDVREKVVSTVKELKAESAALRVIIEEYDAYARRKNKEYDKIFE